MKSIMLAAVAVLIAGAVLAEPVQIGPRPYFLVDQMQDGELKSKLEACADGPFERRLFSIGHRGAPLQFPEHTEQAYRAAGEMGAGIIECDVTFTKDKELVCRHAQDDLHTTTNILVTDLADKCTKPFTPASGDTDASAECRASDITLTEFKTLEGKMDASDMKATTPEAYLGGTADWRTDLYAASAGTLMTHAESIVLMKDLGAKFTPEIKAPAVEMPYEGMTQAQYVQKVVDAYKAAGIPPEDVWIQSFNLDDVRYLIENAAEFGKQAVYLDDRYEASDEDEGEIDPNDPATFKPTMQELADMGVTYIAPPIWMLVTLDAEGKIVPSPYAEAAKEAGLSMITWSLERSGPLTNGGGWYYQSITDAVRDDGVMYEVVDVLAQDVGVVGIFSDWPATATYYANCMGLE